MTMTGILPLLVTTMRLSVALAITLMSALTLVTSVSLVSLTWMATLPPRVSSAWLGHTRRLARLRVPTVLRAQSITTQMRPHRVCRAWLER